jgi:hypothetical protein
MICYVKIYVYICRVTSCCTWCEDRVREFFVYAEFRMVNGERYFFISAPFILFVLMVWTVVMYQGRNRCVGRLGVYLCVLVALQLAPC